MRFDGCKLMGGNLFLGGYFVVIGKTPSFGTGAFTSFTTNAKGAVVQDRLWHIKIFNSFLTLNEKNV
jgi:hypothetical protein